MSRRYWRRWLLGLFLLGLGIVVLELDYSMPMTPAAHEIGLVVGIVLLLVAGATYIYQRAHTSGNEYAWWQDDDWSNWGGM